MPKELITQPDYIPTRKVGMGQAVGSAVTILAWVIETYTELNVPLFIGTAALQLIMFVVQYYVSDTK